MATYVIKTSLAPVTRKLIKLPKNLQLLVFLMFPLGMGEGF